MQQLSDLVVVLMDTLLTPIAGIRRRSVELSGQEMSVKRLGIVVVIVVVAVVVVAAAAAAAVVAIVVVAAAVVAIAAVVDVVVVEGSSSSSSSSSSIGSSRSGSSSSGNSNSSSSSSSRCRPVFSNERKDGDIRSTSFRLNNKGCFITKRKKNQV